MYPDIEIQNILLKYTVKEIGDFASNQLQKLRTSIYGILKKNVGQRTDVQIQLNLLDYLYQIGSGEITVIVNITIDKLDIAVRRPIKFENRWTEESTLCAAEIKVWWTTVKCKFLN